MKFSVYVPRVPTENVLAQKSAGMTKNTKINPIPNL